LPSNVIVPPDAFSSPLTARSVVDLPAPFAPINVTISPGSTAIDTPWSAWIAP
jgi:hypothetical protein